MSNELIVFVMLFGVIILAIVPEYIVHVLLLLFIILIFPFIIIATVFDFIRVTIKNY